MDNRSMSNANNEKPSNLGMVSLFATVLFSSTAITMLRIATLEETVKTVKLDAAEQVALVRTALAEHATLMGHPGVLTAVAASEKMFIEVETQLRAAKERQEQADQHLMQRVDRLEVTDMRRAEEWMPKISKLEERLEERTRRP